MDLMQIYFELSENQTDEYYVELSKKEVLVLPFIIQVANDGSYSERKKSANILEKISKTQPYQTAVFAQYIINAVSKYSDFSSWCLWKSLENIFDLLDAGIVETEFFKAISSQVLGEFSIACDCAEKFVMSYPKSKDKIIAILNNVQNRDFVSNGEVSAVCGEIAVQKSMSALSEINLYYSE